MLRKRYIQGIYLEEINFVMKYNVFEVIDGFAIETTNCLTGEKMLLVGRYATIQDAELDCEKLNREDKEN